MEKANFGQLVSFIFGIANDCLVDVYDVGDYRKIILPMIVLRRFDAVLEPTKQAVLAMKKQLDAAGITDQDEALCSVAGEAFCNSSPYVLSDLKSRTNQQQLKADFILDMVFNATYNPPVAARAGRSGRVSYTVPTSDSTLMVAEPSAPYGKRDGE